MSNKTEVLMCPTCGVETHHVVVLVRKKVVLKVIKIAKRKSSSLAFSKV